MDRGFDRPGCPLKNVSNENIRKGEGRPVSDGKKGLERCIIKEEGKGRNGGRQITNRRCHYMMIGKELITRKKGGRRKRWGKRNLPE